MRVQFTCSADNVADLVARCIPIPGSVDPVYGLSTQAICTQTDESILRDGFRSFPSGHSSRALLSVVIPLTAHPTHQCHLRVLDSSASTWPASSISSTKGGTRQVIHPSCIVTAVLITVVQHKAWISLTPLAGAALVAISRTMDYRRLYHIRPTRSLTPLTGSVDHWHDVLTGSVLGLVVSYFGYRQYFPSLASPLSHRPYGPRIKEQDLLPSYRPSSSHDGDTGTPYLPVSVDNIELEGTVRREEPGPLTEVWKEGEDVESEERPPAAPAAPVAPAAPAAPTA